MPARRETELMLRELGRVQQGVAGRPQLLEHGLSASAVDRLVRVQRLVVRHRGVYQIGPLSLPRAEEHAAVLATGGQARISHRSAAGLRGMLEPGTQVREVEVIMPPGRDRKLHGVRVHRVGDLRQDEFAVLDGLPVTTPARTLLDLGWTEKPRFVEQAYARALRLRLVTSKAMRGMVARHPTHRGAPLWRMMLTGSGDAAFTRSVAEEKMLALAASARLPRPEVNVSVLRHEVDFLWREPRVVVEVDGYAFHSSPRAFGADRRRDAELTAAGYRVLRFTWSDLHQHRLPALVRLAQALAR